MKNSKASRRITVWWLCATLLAMFTLSAHAATSSEPVSTGWMQDANHPYIETRFVLTGRINPEEKTVAGYLEARLAGEWKTYWRSPGEGGIAPKMDWDKSQNITDVEWFWTFPERFDLLGIDTLGYKHNAIFPMKIHVEDISKPVNLDAVLTMSSCTEICVLTDFPIKLQFTPNELAPADEVAFQFAQTMSKVPKPSPLLSDITASWDQNRSQLQVTATHQLGWQKPDIIVDGDSIQMQDANFSLPHIQIEQNQLVATFDVSSWMETPNLLDEAISISFKDGEFVAEQPATVAAGVIASDNTSIISMLLLALLGGFILNIMPCVFPVLGMKLSSVVLAQGVEKKQVRFQFLASSVGILASFWLIATFLVVLKLSGSAIGWGIQFQNGWFIGLMFLITALFGANMLGLYEIRLSSNTNTWLASKGDNSYVGHFTQGMFATLLATPCSAPFLGTAVAFALATNIPTMFGIFTALALGMALPWIAVALFPSIAMALPKPGQWMNRIKYAFGIMMLITSIWLLSLLANHVSESLLYVLIALSAGVLFARITQVHGVKAALMSSTLLIAALGTATLIKKSPSNILPPEPQWETLSVPAIKQYVSEGKVVFVDVTADWCVTCKANKVGVLHQEPVYNQLTGDDVIAMQGDWTVPSDSVTAYLQSYNRYGVPFNIVFGPNAPEGIELPVILTSDVVMDAIKKASGE
ncbi:protein-disulfide reductase DsbD family protein [Vibrio sp. VNB-15]